MKKLVSLSVVAVLGASFLTSCLGDDVTESRQYTYIPLAIDSVSMPDTATLGVPVKIVTYMQMKGACETFYNFDYKPTGENERSITAWGVKDDNKDCSQKESETIAPFFNFKPIDEGTYTLKFWNKTTGEGEEKEHQYITKKIVIKR